MSEQICYVYSTQYDPPRVALMAWVWMPEYQQSIRAEIHNANGMTRTARIYTPYTGLQTVPFSTLQSVALVEGNHVLQAFGRPPAATVPAWVQYAEVG